MPTDRSTTSQGGDSTAATDDATAASVSEAASLALVEEMERLRGRVAAALEDAKHRLDLDKAGSRSIFTRVLALKP